MKRYLVFAGKCFYPRGGTGDYVARFNDLEEAISFCESCTIEKDPSIYPDWAEIVDVQEDFKSILYMDCCTGKIVWWKNREEYDNC